MAPYKNKAFIEKLGDVDFDTVTDAWEYMKFIFTPLNAVGKYIKSHQVYVNNKESNLKESMEEMLSIFFPPQRMCLGTAQDIRYCLALWTTILANIEFKFNEKKEKVSVAVAQAFWQNFFRNIGRIFNQES